MALKSLGLKSFPSPKLNSKSKQKYQMTSNNFYNEFQNTNDNLQSKKYTESQLHDAASQGDLDTINSIIASGSVDINAKDANLKTTALHKAASRNHVDTMKLLMDHGAKKEATDGVDATPLHYAASHGHLEAVATLVLRKVNVNAKDVYGYTAFHAAVKKHHFELADSLRMYGADINTKNETGATALHSACDAADMDATAFLLEHGARQVRDFQGNPPLFKAIAASNVPLCRLMLDHLPVVHDLANAERQTVLHKAAAVSGREALQVLEMVLDHCAPEHLGSLINATDDTGATALHMAAQPGVAYGVTKALVRRGADPTIKDHTGRTPVHICGEHRRTIVAKFLIRNGGKCHKSVAKQLRI
eukprot:gb/GECH01006735.1/.p1 GENE.gb/GECH01006735.1/~~gb/GECH01006735.1/.p1  ORF type:complete len:361 (+),score=80.75 gb/GECH01006735.1/:1-1083(+)